MSEIRERFVEANGLRFAYLEAGSGPLVLLLHGFPDNAWTWEHQIRVLAEAGYRVAAPFLRGCPPTEVPAEPFDPVDVMEDAAALIAALGSGSAYVVGHDWGGLATMNLAALHPQRVVRAVSVAVGHPRTAVEIFNIPSQLHYAFHIWLFQLEGFAEHALRSHDFALVDYLWRHWSSQPVDEEHVARVKKMLNEPGVVESLVSWYRGLVRIPSRRPDFFMRAAGQIHVPMHVIYGAEDPARAISQDEQPYFEGPYVRSLVDEAGHFVHREQPKAFNELLLDWIASG